MKKYAVLLTDDAIADLHGIYDYIAAYDSPEKAEYVAGRIKQAVSGLVNHPQRGTYPKELAELGMYEWREVFFKPYRIIYEVRSGGVYIVFIADGRRDMRTLLQRRLFGS